MLGSGPAPQSRIKRSRKSLTNLVHAVATTVREHRSDSIAALLTLPDELFARLKCFPGSDPLGTSTLTVRPVYSPALPLRTSYALA